MNLCFKQRGMAVNSDITDEALFDLFEGSAITRDNIDVYRHRAKRELVCQRCAACSHYIQPPRSFCPRCLSADVSVQPIAGKGTVTVFSRVHVGAPAPGIDYAAGHVIAVVELEEQSGLRMAGPFMSPDHRSPVIGEPVELVWIDRGSVPVPAFRSSTEEI